MTKPLVDGSDCGRQLCHEPATDLIEVAPSHGFDRKVTARYALCAAHADEYAPEPHAFLHRTASARLRVHCVPLVEDETNA